VLGALLAQYLKSPSSHPIGAGADVRQVYLMGEDTAIVDTNAPSPTLILRACWPRN